MGTVQYGVINQAVFLTDKSMSEKMSTASLNTLLGLGIVFAVLILISLLIYMFKIIPYLQQKMADKSTYTNSSVDNVIAQIVEHEEEELIDDYELVAVITAALYASMGTAVPVDGLIVRSIRKTSKKSWMRA